MLLMTFLRRVLSAQAALWAVFGFVVGVAPGWLLHTVGRQPALTDDAWLRALGVMAVVLALLMMLVSQRLEDVWWWAWAFVVLEAGTATVFMLHALFGLPDGASTWSWWLLAIVNGAFAVLDMVGLGLAAQDKPFS
jgi:hypothetical protein